jgi:hypothetical protein
MKFLEKYPTNGHFSFSKDDRLGSVCNASKTGMGVYLVYAVASKQVTLVYVGSSGQVLQNGLPKHRVGGLYDRIVNGNQFGSPRKNSWKIKIIEEEIDSLEIHWSETFNDQNKDIPSVVEGNILQSHLSMYGHLPRWNKNI